MERRLEAAGVVREMKDLLGFQAREEHMVAVRLGDRRILVLRDSLSELGGELQCAGAVARGRTPFR